MVPHLLIWFYVSFFLEVLPFFWDILDDVFGKKKFIFLTLFFFIFIINHFVCEWKESFNNNGDMLYKFFNFCFRAVSIFFTLLLSEIKRSSLYLKLFKYRDIIVSFSMLIFFKLNDKFVMWKPIFRKWSYFGFYKTNRSKWWKNK